MDEILKKSNRIAGKIFTIKRTVVQSSYIIGLVYQMTDART